MVESSTLTPFGLEKTSVRFGLEKTSVRKMVFCGFSSVNTGQVAMGLVFKQLPLDPANVNACKNMCDHYIQTSFEKLYISTADSDLHSGKRDRSIEIMFKTKRLKKK